MAAPQILPGSELKVCLSDSNDPVVITLDREASFEVLRTQLRGLLSAEAERFRGVHAQIDLGERDIDLFDLRRLVHLVKDEFDLHVVSLRCHPRSVHRFAERELKLKIQTFVPDLPEPQGVEAPEPSLALPEPPPAAIEETLNPVSDPLSPPQGEKTHHVRRTLRSGTVVRFGGDIVVFGDVNPGAQVIAGGSIIVLGALKGMAHAGARGTEDSFILGFDLQPTQLRIGNRIAIPPDNEHDSSARSTMPEIAFLRENQIVIEPYRGRLPRMSN